MFLNLSSISSDVDLYSDRERQSRRLILVFHFVFLEPSAAFFTFVASIILICYGFSSSFGQMLAVSFLGSFCFGNFLNNCSAPEFDSEFITYFTFYFV